MKLINFEAIHNFFQDHTRESFVGVHWALESLLYYVNANIQLNQNNLTATATKIRSQKLSFTAE